MLSSLFKHSFGQGLREGVRIRVGPENGTLLLLHLLRSQAYDVLNHLLRVLAVWQVVNLLLDDWVAKEVAIYVGCRDVGEALNFGAFEGQIKHALAAEEVDLNGIKQGVVEADRGCTVDDDVEIGD